MGRDIPALLNNPNVMTLDGVPMTHYRALYKNLTRDEMIARPEFKKADPNASALIDFAIRNGKIALAFAGVSALLSALLIVTTPSLCRPRSIPTGPIILTADRPWALVFCSPMTYCSIFYEM